MRLVIGAFKSNPLRFTGTWFPTIFSYPHATSDCRGKHILKLCPLRVADLNCFSVFEAIRRAFEQKHCFDNLEIE